MRNIKRLSIPEIDLHGLRAHIGEARLADVMKTAIANGTPRVRVIHGYGQGVMKEIVEQWITEHQNSVEDCEQEDGSMLIYLKTLRF